MVVTRPRNQAHALCDRLHQQGIPVIRFPVIEIEPVVGAPELTSTLQKLRKREYDLAIFISANAVEFGLEALETVWPDSVEIAAIGVATATTLKQHHLQARLVAPAPYNSEALLSLPAFQQCQGQRIVIFRGVGGRELLADSLRRRGAVVEYAECYRRTRPADSDDQLLIQAWRTGTRILFVVTSNEGLHNLVAMIGRSDPGDLLSSYLVVVSERTARLAMELGFIHHPIIAESANIDAIVKAVNTWLTQEMCNE